ncbi:DsbA family protein [Pseudomonas sp. RIT-PI-S]|uniref:DsbA family protein n=1 Tax=Pseudomonas sp. RIT-PI-S TaxID=3035295 RepID=UPI0021DB1A5D|nr:DsbA family protein [Pseudomonas sp. RIT-PI-S]
MKPSVALAFDFLDPWGWIAERRLRAAIAEASQPFTVDYQPCAIAQPRMAGEPYRAYQARRFGSDAQVFETRALDQAAQLGVALDFERIATVPDTRLAGWVLRRCSADEQTQRVLFEAIYQAYFCDGQDIGLPAVLSRLLGYPCPPWPATADSEQALLQDEQATAAWCGRMMPSVRVGHKVIAGAQPPSVLARYLRY